MFSLGSTYFLLFVQVVTAMLPDLVIKIIENLRKSEFVRNEKWNAQQRKFKKNSFNNTLKSANIFKVENDSGKVETEERASKMSFSETVEKKSSQSSNGILDSESIESTSINYLNLINSISPKEENHK